MFPSVTMGMVDDTRLVLKTPAAPLGSAAAPEAVAVPCIRFLGMLLLGFIASPATGQSGTQVAKEGDGEGG